LVESRVLGQQLYKILKDSDVELIIPANVSNIEEEKDGVKISVKKGQKKPEIRTRLLVAADGTHSRVREMAGISVHCSDYNQSAIIANVSTEKPHHGRAFERFTEKGPIALLPMSENRCSLVWTHSTKKGSEDLDATMALNDEEFLNKLDEAFGYRLGRFIKVGKRSCYPLSLVTSDVNTAYRTVIIGNASHTLHPVAGQGLNLALRDVAVLSDLVADLMANKTNTQKLSNVDDLLRTYEKLRAGDLKNTVRYTDSLVRLFSNDNILLGHARAGGLLAVDRMPPLRKWLTRQSMGINYRQSRLARGLALRSAT
jgi:2-octaprenyl-6-methoxyphenol hydroxylase